MKKLFLLSFFSFVVISSYLLAQTPPPSDITSAVPVQHLQAVYKITSAKKAPRATVTWVADLQNDTAPFLYQVTVTLQNETDKIFDNWNLSPLFIGSIPTHQEEKMIDDPNNPDQKMKVPMNIFDVSSAAQIRGEVFSDGPAPGFAIFGGTLEKNSLNLPAHGSITFNYTYQLSTTQKALLPPVKMILTRGFSYVAGPSDVITGTISVAPTTPPTTIPTMPPTTPPVDVVAPPPAIQPVDVVAAPPVLPPVHMTVCR